jgi:hypothetical protein
MSDKGLFVTKGIRTVHQPNRVLAWLGIFESESAFERYVEERYTDDGDAIPSGFIRDIGIEWFDHDFQEFEFHDPPLLISEAVNGHSYSASFAPSLIAAARAKGYDKVQAIFLLYDLEQEPKSPSRESPVRFIGAFPYAPR